MFSLNYTITDPHRPNGRVTEIHPSLDVFAFAFATQNHGYNTSEHVQTQMVHIFHVHSLPLPTPGRCRSVSHFSLSHCPEYSGSGAWPHSVPGASMMVLGNEKRRPWRKRTRGMQMTRPSFGLRPLMCLFRHRNRLRLGKWPKDLRGGWHGVAVRVLTKREKE